MNFLNKVIPELTKDYDCFKHDKWWPKCYIIKNNTVIMEDLRIQGFKVLDSIYDKLPIIKSAIMSIARFHSCSILAEGRMNRNSKVSANAMLENHKRIYFFVLVTLSILKFEIEPSYLNSINNNNIFVK